MIMNTNEGLYKYDADGNISLGMASDVEISEDGCTYTFTTVSYTHLVRKWWMR